MFPHLPVCICHICIRHKFLDLRCHFSYILDTVIDIVHLSLAGNFSFDCLPDHLIILLHHIGLDRHPVNWCFFQHTHVTDSDQTHMKRSGNRCCRKCQNINIFLQLFDLFFMLYSKTLFLINDQKSQIFKCHILTQYPVGSDDNINLSLFQIFDRFFLLCRCAETA